jgi:hypothetical protein
VRPEPVADQYSRSLISSFFSLGIEYTLKPLQADLRVGIARIRAGIVPSRGRECGPVASMSTSWPDNYRV